ncbi:AAA family ATPase [Tessaracoccus sp. MC1679]|uniref:ATP-dependent nuclease n=1 Tax=Tessaracoccus sp. MC1679 TaxID=2760313 RepID=UPI0015FFFF3B|nr:AAA family ATPase [Tessaracoccus sp. MC1679]MBB1515751.1 AAA family ATPase [Tessaracoccus sp. MC1679]
MKVRQLEIENFRGVCLGKVVFADNTLLVGGNNVGKSTVCEALDLVLGPERTSRRPVVDEHDFHRSTYLDADKTAIPIVIRAVVVDLPDEARRRFGGHLRRWNDTDRSFVDDLENGAEHADDEGVTWALPVSFRARYDAVEDDFEADTFFEHPLPELDELDDEEASSLGGGRDRFTRAHKRLCGFVYLRALRTGSRALGLQRGSLLDTVLRLSEEGSAEMWMETLRQMRDLDPAIGAIPDLESLLTQIRERAGGFVRLAGNDDATAFFASDLTREHLREVVRLFVATGPSDHAVPFTRQGTGTVNLLVFALLTMIADLKERQSVIFAMEEPEIALPPHTQRRVARFVKREMGQAIVTSHSPYVIEQFEPNEIIMLSHESGGDVEGMPINPAGIKLKSYRSQRRQFSEAILSRGVLVVEGETEASILPIAAAVLEKSSADYVHPDLAGVTIFTANGDGDVPRWAPILRALGKVPFGMVDKQTTPYTGGNAVSLKSFEEFWESPVEGIEELIVSEVPTAVLRRFMDKAVQLPDFPAHQAKYDSSITDADLPEIALKTLEARKGDAYGYAALLIEGCQSRDDLPEFLVAALERINEVLTPAATPTDAHGQPVDDEAADGDE